jgi:hypothetical protein
MSEKIYLFVCLYMSQTFVISSSSKDIVNNIISDDGGILLVEENCHLALT